MPSTVPTTAAPTTSSPAAAPTPAQARIWLERWDHQQERYVADREERFQVILDVVAAATSARTPAGTSATSAAVRALDLGCGPGSLSVRLLDCFPGATVVAVDADPLLLGLGRAGYGDREGLTFLDADLRGGGRNGKTADGAGGWDDAPDGSFDAVVSTTALHWLTRDELAGVYARCAALLRPGGVLVDGDHLDEGVGQAGVDALAAAVEQGRAERVGVTGNEEWGPWWEAVGAAPELAGLVGERGARPIEHAVPEVPSLADHAALLREAGFAEVGTVWQCGADRVLVALR